MKITVSAITFEPDVEETSGWLHVVPSQKPHSELGFRFDVFVLMTCFVKWPNLYGSTPIRLSLNTVEYWIPHGLHKQIM